MIVTAGTVLPSRNNPECAVEGGGFPMTNPEESGGVR